MKLVHIAGRQPNPELFPEIFQKALRQIGDFILVENGARLSQEEHLRLIRSCTVLLTGWGSSPVPEAIALERGQLRCICHLTGTLRAVIPLALIEAGIPVTNWGDAPAYPIAEGAMALLLAVLKDLRLRIQTVSGQGWAPDGAQAGGSLDGLNVGIYGCGVIGRRFIELIRPFQPVLRVYDPYALDLPADCIRVKSLEELFSQSEAIVIHAGLSNETRRTVTAALLARLPRHGIVINTARGAIIDQEALFAELASGRLRAGLDVLEPDSLPAGHPARSWSNCILTAHQISQGWPTDGRPPAKLSGLQKICLDNLRRFVNGEPLRFLFDRERYLRST